MLKLTDDVAELGGVGPKYNALLNDLGIFTIEDLLLHIPIRYEDRTNAKKISEVVAGEKVLVTGTVEKIENIFSRNRKRITKAVVSDETGKLEVIWFNQFYIKRKLSVGTRVSLFGSLSMKSAKPLFVSPDWTVCEESGGEKQDKEQYLPVYHLTSGLSLKWLRNKIKQALELTRIENILPKDKIQNFEDREIALKNVHFPKNMDEARKAREILSFEELTLFHLKAIKLREAWRKKINGHEISLTRSELDQFKSSLPYQLTSSQNRVIEEILDDMQEDTPMNRLLLGDVGSGKTTVAAVAILACIKSNFNCVYLAPTQILANQHYETLNKLFSKLEDIEISLHTSKDTKSNGKKNAKGQLIVGTHAILHRLESFSNIGLIIIDEQHKFGVDQRSKIIDYYSDQLVPNLLTMTATPIPRSLALIFYGDLDISVIDELPTGRKQVKTMVIPEKKRPEIFEWINDQIEKNGDQVFFVCPFVEESRHEKFQFVKAAETEFKNVKKVFPDKNVGLLHGRLRNEEKGSVIENFRKKRIDILVTTPVIEVGVDIPNANIICIQTAERFGLASLHQLRGRVGRGKKQAYCILMASTLDKAGIQRLKYMETIHDGGRLAEIDLKSRGPGDLYGVNQHGFPKLKVADITDYGLVKKTKSVAYDLFENLNKYPILAKKLDEISIVENN